MPRIHDNPRGWNIRAYLSFIDSVRCPAGWRWHPADDCFERASPERAQATSEPAVSSIGVRAQATEWRRTGLCTSTLEQSFQPVAVPMYADFSSTISTQKIRGIEIQYIRRVHRRETRVFGRYHPYKCSSVKSQVMKLHWIYQRRLF